MTITVIGHLCLDVIHHPDGKETRSYGGIYFSLATLANLLPSQDTILPVFGVGKEEYEQFLEHLKLYPNVDISGIYKFAGPTNQVHLLYNDSAERVECSRFIADPIAIKRIRPYLKTNMLLINMISGFDITLETLDEIRMETRDHHTPIYMDIHSLTLGINENFTRFLRPVDAWRRWLFMLHTAQMNEQEAHTLSSEKLDEVNLANQTLALNTKSMIITRGKRGCTAFIDEHKHAQRFDIPGMQPELSVDPTGCGDVFAAAYCAHFMKTNDISNSVRFANQVAALKSRLQGSLQIDKLSTFRLLEMSTEVSTT